MDFEDHEEHDQHMTCEFSNLKMDIPLPAVTTATTPEAPPLLSSPPPPQPRKPKYKECLKNHALSLGGHAVDGCGEFMPAGIEGTLDALKCAACSCHRNFHRKESDENILGGLMPPPYNMQPHYFSRSGGPSGYLHVGVPQQQRLLALPCSSSGGGQYSREEYHEDALISSGGGSGKKRFRTKFTQEQKEKMFELAERLGWRIQKHDEDAVQQFCEESGVKRNVFKVWMHNNKNTLGKKP